MSSLIFRTDEDKAFVATDTLASSPDGEPAFFTTKVFIVPHLRLVICGIGISGFLGRWFIEINDRMVVKGIDHLNYHTPINLLRLWRDYLKGSSIPDNLTATIYHFGFSEEDSLIHSYAYRSTKDFNSDKIPYCTGVKPKCQIPEQPVFPTDIKKIMDRQRADQASLPQDKRVYIGGNIQVHHLTREGFFVYTLDQFEDYLQTENAIYKNFDSIKGAGSS
jgi:hypothetical protein